MCSAVKPAPFDDVLMAMDVVDTLRHRAELANQDIAHQQSEAELIDRLREIYKSQGIDVPDNILRDGVKALAEQRFVYTPPPRNLQTRLALIYICRDKWLKPLLLALGAILLLWLTYYSTVVAPRQTAMQETIPAAVARDFAAASNLTNNAGIQQRLRALRDENMAALQAGDYEKAKATQQQLAQLTNDLKQEYQIRIISRPNAYSGVFRIPDNNKRQRNFYLIVEAVDNNNNPVTVLINSEEDQKSARTSTWGVRVSEQVFNDVAADKADDQIIQNAVIGYKLRGVLTPEYTIPTQNGFILEW